MYLSPSGRRAETDPSLTPLVTPRLQHQCALSVCGLADGRGRATWVMTEQGCCLRWCRRRPRRTPAMLRVHGRRATATKVKRCRMRSCSRRSGCRFPHSSALMSALLCTRTGLPFGRGLSLKPGEGEKDQINERVAQIPCARGPGPQPPVSICASSGQRRARRSSHAQRIGLQTVECSRSSALPPAIWSQVGAEEFGHRQHARCRFPCSPARMSALACTLPPPLVPADGRSEPARWGTYSFPTGQQCSGFMSQNVVSQHGARRTT